ncbi:hypothetical protein AAL_01065 [Moelleriella libera RCEF 2490]|uniref:Uncharacterized protein n=1 Tax=Moelleriella libera RCEF 2490 TaxID=1081109 RepID=A0A166VFD2_9HYPO|nr:hypothetical protein AAL_01065 [Moelleriella libera RCEF 2490]
MDPPPYCEEPPDYSASALLPPATFFIAQNVVYSDQLGSSGSGSGSGSTPSAVFELSQQPFELRDTTRTVSMDRLDRALKVHHSGEDGDLHHTITIQKRHMWDLKHPAALTGPVFLYHADAASKHALCSFGMSTFRPRLLSTRLGYRVHRMVKHPLEKHVLLPRGLLFEAQPAPRRRSRSADGNTVTFEWCDSSSSSSSSSGAAELGGQLLARELPGPRLFVTKEMDGKKREALVAAWVLRLWWERAGSQHYELGRDGG